MLWYLPIEKIHYKYVWPWVGSNVDGPSGGGYWTIVSLSIRNDVRKNREWSYLEAKWNLLWMVISRFVGQTSKFWSISVSECFRYNSSIRMNTMWYQPQINKPLGCQISQGVQPTVVWDSSPSWGSQESLVPAPTGFSWFPGSTGVTMKFCLRAMLGFSVPWCLKWSAGCHGSIQSPPKWISMDCLTMNK